MKKSLALAAGLLLGLSAGSGVASADVSADQLQNMISSQMAARAGSPPDAVVCPEGLITTAGSAVTCQVTMGGETRGVTVSVASVDENGVNFSMQVAGS